MYRDPYPLPQKSQIEHKIDQIADLVAENKRLTNEFMERMDKICQKITEIKAKMEEPLENLFTSPTPSDIIET